MSLGEEYRIENVCDTASYQEIELEELVGILREERCLSEIVTSIINQYIGGYTLTEKQENVLCYEYIKRYKRDIILIG